jgi:hypothetical protein
VIITDTEQNINDLVTLEVKRQLRTREQAKMAGRATKAKPNTSRKRSKSKPKSQGKKPTAPNPTKKRDETPPQKRKMRSGNGSDRPSGRPSLSRATRAKQWRRSTDAPGSSSRREPSRSRTRSKSSSAGTRRN